MKPYTFLLLVLLALCSCDQQTCDFNIDKHEILMGLDIPATMEPFHCEPLDGKKISFFQIDMDKFKQNNYYRSLDEYIQLSDLERIPEGYTDYLQWVSLFPESLQKLEESAELYVKHSKNENKPWHLLMDKSTARIWAIVGE